MARIRGSAAAAAASAPAPAAADHDSTVATAKAAELLAAAADCDGIHGHSMFFDALVQLIPPRFYLSTDDDVRPYYQGLSKAAKAAMKAQSRANIKAARRARLDPAGPPSSTLDLLKKSVADQEAEEKEEEEEEGQDKSQDESQESDDEATSEGGDDDQDNEEGDEEEEEEEEEEAEDEKEEMQMAPAAVVSEDRSVTYEELRDRLHRRITELRGNRCTRPEFLNKPQKEKGKKAKGAKVKGKDEGTKRKHEDDTEGKDGKKHKKEAEEKAPDIMYGNVLVDPKEARRRKKRRIKNKKKELEQAKQMQRAKEDPNKATKMAWDVATRRAAGEKVHDNPKLIKESMKKDKKRQQKHAEEWKDRQRTVDIKRKQKQNKRKENIQERAQEKKARKIEKREKKLMRPGFEGRKEGYVNE